MKDKQYTQDKFSMHKIAIKTSSMKTSAAQCFLQWDNRQFEASAKFYIAFPYCLGIPRYNLTRTLAAVQINFCDNVFTMKSEIIFKLDSPTYIIGSG